MSDTVSILEIIRGLKARRVGSHWMGHCPAHEDRTPSLSIDLRNGKLLLHCFGGCPQTAVIDALRARGLWTQAPPRNQQHPRERPDPDYPGDLLRAEYWRCAAIELAELTLDQMSPTDPDRRQLTRWVDAPRCAGGAALVALYRRHRAADPLTSAGMVFSGRRYAARLQERLAAWMMRGCDGSF
jgi:hypothetical protein